MGGCGGSTLDTRVSMWTTRRSTWENGEGARLLAAWPVRVDTCWAQKALGRDQCRSRSKRLQARMTTSLLKVLSC